ncbi:MAG: N-acetyltransferase [Solirubrobacteraceae bacterium]|nr:N-acetyltransferase [Solirubrobacteraceae bacterium]
MDRGGRGALGAGGRRRRGHRQPRGAPDAGPRRPLAGMAIVAPARGRGGGRMLMDTALRHIATTDAHKVELEVWPDNGRAISLYAGYGFEVEGLRRDHPRRRDGSLRSSLIMARLLQPAGERQSRPGSGT